MDLHALVSALKTLALELDRVPNKKEFFDKAGVTEWATRKHGGYSVIVQAAGLEMPRYNAATAPKNKKITNAIFNKDLTKHLEDYKPREILLKTNPFVRIAIISDIHWPFHSQAVIDAFIEFIRVFQPLWVVLNGDAWDMYSHTKFPRSHNCFTPREEQSMARAQNELFWKRVKEVCPNAQCVQMLGNHDLRPMKRVLESYPEAEDWVAAKVREIFSFDGVRTIHDAREELTIGDVVIHHGYKSQLGAHRDYMLMNSANGHSHVGGVVFRRIHGRTLFELNSGYAADPEAKGLTYTPQKITNWTPGFAAIDEYGPRFIMVG